MIFFEKNTSTSSGGQRKTIELLNTTFQIYELEQKRLLDLLNEGAEKEKSVYTQRLGFLTDFNIQSKNLINERLKEEQRRVNEKLALDITNLSKERSKKGADTKGIDAEIFALRANAIQQLNLLEAKAADERIRLADSFNKRLLALHEAYNKEDLFLTTLHQGDTKKSAEKASQQYAEYLQKEQEEFVKHQVELLKRQQDDENKKKELIQNSAKEIESIFFDAIKSRADAKQAELDQDLANIDTRSQAEIAAINASGLAEGDKAKRIAEIEKQSLFDKAKVEEQKQKIAKKTKDIQKIAGVAEIAANTATSLFDIQRKAAQARAEAALLASSPFTVALAPNALIQSGLILAQIPSILASAGFQLARLAFFKDGTLNAPKGPAIVGEEGSELMKDSSGKWSLTPAGPTLMNLKGGEQIYDAEITRQILMQMSLGHLMNMNRHQVLPNNVGVEINNRLQEKIYGKLDEISRKTGIVIHNQQNIETTAYYLNNMKN